MTHNPKRLTAERLDYLRAAADEIHHTAVVHELLDHIAALEEECFALGAEIKALRDELDQSEDQTNGG
jgi:uncharacterized coiled-coil DUF342 family protein